MKMRQSLRPRQQLRLNVSKKAVLAGSSIAVLALFFGVVFIFNIGNVRDSSAGNGLTSKKTGQWTGASVWKGGSTPGSNDDVTIDGHTVTIPKNTTLSCNNLSIEDGKVVLEKGSSLTVANDLEIMSYFSSGVIELNGDAELIVKKDIVFDGIAGTSSLVLKQNSTLYAAGDFNSAGTVTTEINCQDQATIVLNGQSVQEIPSSGNTITYQNLTIDNQSSSTPDITLAGSIVVNGTLTLDHGIIKTDTVNTLTIGGGGSVSGFSDSSFINGPIYKSGQDDFEYEFKTATGFARVGLVDLTADATFKVNYQRKSPVQTNSLQSGLSAVSSKEYWQIDRVGGSGNARVKLYWEDADSSGITNLGDLVVAHYNESNQEWESVGRSSVSGTTGSGGTGYIISNSVSSFSPFTFGSSGGLSPLPVELVEFSIEMNDNKVFLNWKTASEENNDHFIIQKSEKGEYFSDIGRVNGAGTSTETQEYTYTDPDIFSNIIYYRLKQVDHDGSYDYSPVRVVDLGDNDRDDNIRIENLGPNPFRGQFMMEIFSYRDVMVNITLTSLNGKVLHEESVRIYEGRNTYRFENGHDLEEGIYILHMLGKGIAINKKLIKR